jgi:hypothetical protein
MGILLIFVCNKYHRTLNNDELSHWFCMKSIL